MTGDLTPTKGTVNRHTHLSIGRYHQHSVDQLDNTKTVLQFFKVRLEQSHAYHMTDWSLHSFLDLINHHHHHHPHSSCLPTLARIHPVYPLWHEFNSRDMKLPFLVSPHRLSAPCPLEISHLVFIPPPPYRTPTPTTPPQAGTGLRTSGAPSWAAMVSLARCRPPRWVRWAVVRWAVAGCSPMAYTWMDDWCDGAGLWELGTDVTPNVIVS